MIKSTHGSIHHYKGCSRSDVASQAFGRRSATDLIDLRGKLPALARRGIADEN